MVPIYLCDDEPAVCGRIAALVEQQLLILGLDMGPVRSFTKADALLAAHRADEVPAIYLLDVDLRDSLDGFALAVELRRRDPRGYIIFITGHGELSFETFRYRLEAMDYIEKGGEDEMARRLQSCLASIQQRLGDARRDSSYYTIKLFGSIRHIPVAQILYFEAHGKQHRISLHTDDEILEFFGSLQTAEDELGSGFFRCHRGFLVNRARIDNIRPREALLELDNGETCPLSRTARKSLSQGG